MNIAKKVALFGTTALLLMACGEVEPRIEEVEPVEDDIEVVETQEEETVEDAEETIEEVEKNEEDNTEDVEEEGNNLPDSKELAKELEEMGIETFDEEIEALFGDIGDIEFNKETNIYEIHPYDSDIASLMIWVSGDGYRGR